MLKSLLYLLIFTIPLDNRILFTLGIDRLLPVRVVLLVLLAVSHRRILKELKNLREDKIGLVLVALWTVRLISLVRTQNLQNSLGLLAFYTTMIGLYLVLKSVSKEYGRDFVLKLLRVYLLVGLLTGVFSIVQYICYKFFGIVLPAVWPTEHQPVRVGSTFWDINHYAAYLLTILPSLAAFAICKKTLIEKKMSASGGWVAYGGFAFGLLVLGMTLSRSAWISFALSISLMLVLLTLKKYFEEVRPLFLFLSVAAFGVVIGTIFFDLPVADRLYTFFDVYNNDAIQAHNLILRGGFEVFKKFPILGGGYGGFNEHFRQTPIAALYFQKDPVSWAHLPAHSVWMETLAETGIVGFGLYATLMGLVLRTVFAAILKTEDRFLNILSIATFSSLAGVFLSGIFYSYNLEFFWFFIFLSVSLARLSTTVETGHAPSLRKD